MVWVSSHIKNQPSIGIYASSSTVQCSNFAANYVCNMMNGRSTLELSELPHVLSHEMVNRWVNFVDPASGIHMQNTAAMLSKSWREWRRVMLISYLIVLMSTCVENGMIALRGRHWKTAWVTLLSYILYHCRYEVFQVKDYD